jgi:uncharacterized repeat protein (TIGR04076 family)
VRILEQYDVKITVAKKLSTKDVFGSSPPRISKDVESVCPRFKEGDTYVSEKGSCPQGFCSWAFADIQRDIAHLRFGGSYPWMQEQGVAYSCCTDGLRPVIFRLERVK